MLWWLCGEGVTGCYNCDEFSVLVPGFSLHLAEMKCIARQRQDNLIENTQKVKKKNPFASLYLCPVYFQSLLQDA